MANSKLEVQLSNISYFIDSKLYNEFVNLQKVDSKVKPFTPLLMQVIMKFPFAARLDICQEIFLSTGIDVKIVYSEINRIMSLARTAFKRNDKEILDTYGNLVVINGQSRGNVRLENDHAYVEKLRNYFEKDINASRLIEIKHRIS